LQIAIKVFINVDLLVNELCENQLCFFLVRHNHVPITVLAELQDGSLQERYFYKAYHSKLIAVSFVFINYFSKYGLFFKKNCVKNWQCCLTQRLYVWFPLGFRGI